MPGSAPGNFRAWRSLVTKTKEQEVLIMHSRTLVGAGILVAALCAATGAQALHAPAVDGARPGPYAFQIASGSDLLDPAANGFVNRTTGAFAIRTALNEGPYAGGPESAARAFLEAQGGLYGLTRGTQNLALDAIREAPGNRYAAFRQTLGGVPVWGADIVVTLDESARFVQAVSSGYDPITAGNGLSVVPSIDAAAAERAARAAVGIAAGQGLIGEPAAPALWVLRDEQRAGSPARLVWRVSLPVNQPLGDWEVWVDAHTGAIVRLSDDAFYTDGSGLTFDPDPLTTAGVVYGGQYVDNNDADNTALNDQRFTRALPDITLSGGLYYLQGPWVYIDEFEAPQSPPVTNPDPNGFNYTRSAQGFEDVLVYHAIDMSQRYMQSLGYTTIQHAPIHVDTHGLSGADNSHYIPSSNRIAYGEGGVDDAEDYDVVLHEYGHSIQSSIVPGWGTSTQARSMGEGFGDYWAGSYSQSISDWHSEWVFSWDGHNPFWGGRILNSTLGYSNLNNDIYHDGTIWASCLWLMRTEAGRTVLDNDVLKLHFGLPGSATMQQAAASAMQADRTLYGGLHSGTLDYYFTLRGFFTASQYDVPELTHTPIPDQPGSGPFPLVVTVASTSAVTSVKVKYTTGTTFDQEVALTPTGNPNQWGGSIPDQGPNVDIRYYIYADNAANWRGASPRGAEYRYNQFHATGGTDAVDENGHALRLELAAVRPNPTSGPAGLTFTLPASGSVRLAVYGLDGRELRVLASGPLAAGRHSSAWDGRDASGRELPAGLYLAKLDAEGRSLTQKVLVVK